jgi:acetyltransferase-like isoleucine patch superfamily enzyme
MLRENVKSLIFGLNGIIHRMILGDIVSPCRISPFATFTGCRSNIHIGANTTVFSKAYIHCESPGGIRIGSGCEIHSYARIMNYGGNITIGDYCSVNPYSILYGHGGLEIGSMVRIASQVIIIPGNHGIDNTEIPIMEQGIDNEKIVIKDNVWIAAGAKILGGVTINSGAVVGANAVVVRDVPENAVVVGVPSKIIRFRGERRLIS